MDIWGKKERDTQAVPVCPLRRKRDGSRRRRKRRRRRRRRRAHIFSSLSYQSQTGSSINTSALLHANALTRRRRKKLNRDFFAALHHNSNLQVVSFCQVLYESNHVLRYFFRQILGVPFFSFSLLLSRISLSSFLPSFFPSFPILLMSLQN